MKKTLLELFGKLQFPNNFRLKTHFCRSKAATGSLLAEKMQGLGDNQPGCRTSLLFAVIMSLCFFSCSGYIFPKQIEVKGTVYLPVRTGISNLGSLLIDVFEKAFSNPALQNDFISLEQKLVYNVDYPGITIQTFCIYLPIEMTEDLHPDDFLQIISAYMKDNMSINPADFRLPLPPPVSFPLVGMGIGEDGAFEPLSIPLTLMAKYVNYINFDECTVDGDGKPQSGMGINFYFPDIVDGITMQIICDELHINETKVLESGNNVFGNKEDLSLVLEQYREDYAPTNKTLNFDFKIVSFINPGVGPTNPLEAADPSNWPVIEGQIQFFQFWTEAEINLRSAIKNAGGSDEYYGEFPAIENGEAPFDLSSLKDYLGGEFTFNGLEVKMYTNSPIKVSTELSLAAKYTKNGSSGPVTVTDSLYDQFEIELDSNTVTLNLNGKGDYADRHLPEWSAGDEENSRFGEVIAGVLDAKPDNLVFTYDIILDGTITLFSGPDGTFSNIINSGTGSSVGVVMMIMLPLNLDITGEENAWIAFPGMFGTDSKDLFGRDNPSDLIKGVDINFIRFSIGFLDPFFTGGHLYIDKEKLLFPDTGIVLNGKRIIMNITGNELETIQNNLIYPDVRLEFSPPGSISVPKNVGITDITIEMNVNVNPGELFE